MTGWQGFSLWILGVQLSPRRSSDGNPKSVQFSPAGLEKAQWLSCPLGEIDYSARDHAAGGTHGTLACVSGISRGVESARPGGLGTRGEPGCHSPGANRTPGCRNAPSCTGWHSCPRQATAPSVSGGSPLTGRREAADFCILQAF